MWVNTSLYENTYDRWTKFSFWKNWKEFLLLLDDRRIEEAKTSIRDFLWFDLEGKTFIDVWCGSGLFSLSAYLLWAKEVVSLDVDEHSISCVRVLRERQWNPTNRKIVTWSVLDTAFVKSLGTFDVVYSRWVLHHTWNMYKAFDNVVHLLWHHSVFYLAIYNRYLTSKARWYIKKLYNYTPKRLKRFWIVLYYLYATILLAAQKKWIISEIKHYWSSRWSGRGMSYHTDVIDWLWWYPYEYATTQELIAYFKKHDLKAIKHIDGSWPACNEVLFEKL